MLTLCGYIFPPLAVVKVAIRPVSVLLAMLLATPAWSQPGPPAVLVVTASVESRQMAPSQWVSAQVESRNQGMLALEVSGRLVAVAEIGDRVEAGAVLAQVDDQLLRAELVEARAEIDSEVARLGFLDKEVKRLQRLAKSNNAARTQLDETEAERDSTTADLDAARARFAVAKLKVERTQLKAPYAGVVVHRALRVGEWADSNSPVLRLLDNYDLEAVASAPLTLLPYVQQGMAVRLSAGEMQGTGQISAVVPGGDPISQRLTVRIALDEQPWLPGQALRVALPTAAATEAVAVPRDALVLRRGGAHVFKVSVESTAEFVPVQLGVAEGDWIQVLGPLQPGDQVVTRGNERLRPGQAVQARSMGALPPPDSAKGEAGQ